MSKYTQQNKTETLYKPFQALPTKKAKIKFLENLLQERKDFPENFKIKLTQKQIQNHINNWQTKRQSNKDSTDDTTLNDMK